MLMQPVWVIQRQLPGIPSTPRGQDARKAALLDYRVFYRPVAKEVKQRLFTMQHAIHAGHADKRAGKLAVAAVFIGKNARCRRPRRCFGIFRHPRTTSIVSPGR